MSTCGYICPACGGNKILETGLSCHWCIPDKELVNEENQGEKGGDAQAHVESDKE